MRGAELTPRDLLAVLSFTLQAAKRDEVKAKNPGLAAKEIASKCGELWREMSDKQKAQYKVRASERTPASRTWEQRANRVDSSSESDPLAFVFVSWSSPPLSVQGRRW